MNESEKNIETCLPESILADVSALPQDPQFVSLVNESLDPLKQQAVQQAGSDAYNEVVASHQPYTFTSSVRQMKSNLILLLRRFWRFPFGSGTIRSLSDMWAHYITRLQGSETYGIPSRLDQLTDLPSAPLLVADRKISGAIGAPDGVSLLHLLTETTAKASVTELIDEDTWDAVGVSVPISTLPNVSKVTTHVRSVEQDASGQTTFLAKTLDELNAPDLEYIGVKKNSAYTYVTYFQRLVTGINSEVVHIPSLKRIFNSSSNGADNYGKALGNLPNCKRLLVENLKDIRTSCSSWLGKGTGTQCLANAPECLELITAIEGDTNANNASADYKFIIAPKLRKFFIGGVLTTRNDKGLFYTTSTDLIHLEIGGATCSLYMNEWSPTNALDATGTDLVEDPTAHPTWNNLQQFLQNFRSFIVLRLANRKTTTALTLTLSANVYNAVTGANSGWASQHTLAELGITAADLTDLETELGITSSTIYATWLDTFTGANGIHWDINKAN